MTQWRHNWINYGIVLPWMKRGEGRGGEKRDWEWAHNMLRRKSQLRNNTHTVLPFWGQNQPTHRHAFMFVPVGISRTKMNGRLYQRSGDYRRKTEVLHAGSYQHDCRCSSILCHRTDILGL